jgi:hypothetical protein
MEIESESQSVFPYQARRTAAAARSAVAPTATPAAAATLAAPAAAAASSAAQSTAATAEAAAAWPSSIRGDCSPAAAVAAEAVALALAAAVAAAVAVAVAAAAVAVAATGSARSANHADVSPNEVMSNPMLAMAICSASSGLIMWGMLGADAATGTAAGVDGIAVDQGLTLVHVRAQFEQLHS